MSWRTVVVALIALQALAVMLYAGWHVEELGGKSIALGIIGVDGLASWIAIGSVAPDIKPDPTQGMKGDAAA
jgi:hypothetical protein